jgi:S-DNA-T family DNA segregation ATPase FtsK/SpoIIIE
MTDLTTLLEVGGPVAALGGGAAYARAKHPGVYWSTVGLPISTARLLSSYGSVMEACGLTVAPSRLRMLAVKATTRREVRPVPPRRGIIRPTSTGLRIRLRLAPGQEPADVAASAERLRHAWGVHAVYVSTVKPGVVELRLVGFDVLHRVRMPRKIDSGLLSVPVALREDATPFVRDYRTVPHQRRPQKAFITSRVISEASSMRITARRKRVERCGNVSRSRFAVLTPANSPRAKKCG